MFENTIFVGSGRLDSNPDKLEYRFKNLLERNKDVISGKRVLDLGCYDGRFCYGAVKLGALLVTGVEPRIENFILLNKFRDTYGFPNVFFYHDDAIGFLRKLTRGEYDTVLCLGLFYHLASHVELIDALRGCEPRHIILDTLVCDHTAPIILFKDSDPNNKMSKFGGLALGGRPSRKFVQHAFTRAGFSVKELEMEKDKDGRVPYLITNG